MPTFDYSIDLFNSLSEGEENAFFCTDCWMGVK